MDTAYCVLYLDTSSLPRQSTATERLYQPVARGQHDACATVLTCPRKLLKGETHFNFSSGKFHIERRRNFEN